METDIQKYEKCLLEIKQRMEVVRAHVSKENTTKYFVTEVEFICLQFRKIIELIAFSSMVANREEYERFRANAEGDFKNDWKAKNIFLALKKVNPKFYPAPSAQVEKEPKKGFKVIKLEPIKDGFMTEKEAIKIHERCGGFLHAWNPFSNDKDLKEIYALFPIWGNKIIRLLSHHTIVLTHKKLLIGVEMESTLNNGNPKVFPMKQLTDKEFFSDQK